MTSAAALIALVAMAGPETARAGDDFERGFKRELGAIAAQEVVGMGRHILLGAVTGYPRYVDRHVHRGYRDRRYHRSRSDRWDRYDDRYWKRHLRRHHHRRQRSRVVHEHHHYYGDGCGH